MSHAMTKTFFLVLFAALTLGCGGDDDESESGAEGSETAPATGDGSNTDTGAEPQEDACEALTSRMDCSVQPGCTWVGGRDGACQSEEMGGFDDDDDGNGDGNGDGGPSTNGDDGSSPPDCAAVPTPFVCLTTIGCTWQNETCVAG